MKCKKHLELPTTVHSFLFPLKNPNILIIPHIQTHPQLEVKTSPHTSFLPKEKKNEWEKWLSRLRLTNYNLIYTRNLLIAIVITKGIKLYEDYMHGIYEGTFLYVI